MLLATRLPSSLPWEPSMVKRCGRKGIRSSADSGQRLLSMPFPVVFGYLGFSRSRIMSPQVELSRTRLRQDGQKPQRRGMVTG